MKKILFATLLCLVLAAPAVAQDDAALGPVGLKITGYMTEAPKGVTPKFTWTFGNGGKTSTLQVIKTEFLSDSVMAEDINEAFNMNKPMFELAGDIKAINTFASAKSGQIVKISGNMRPGGTVGRIMVDTVEIVPEAK